MQKFFRGWHRGPKYSQWWFHVTFFISSRQAGFRFPLRGCLVANRAWLGIGSVWGGVFGRVMADPLHGLLQQCFEDVFLNEQQNSNAEEQHLHICRIPDSAGRCAGLFGQTRPVSVADHAGQRTVWKFGPWLPRPGAIGSSFTSGTSSFAPAAPSHLALGSVFFGPEPALWRGGRCKQIPIAGFGTLCQRHPNSQEQVNHLLHRWFVFNTIHRRVPRRRGPTGPARGPASWYNRGTSPGRERPISTRQG